MALGVDVLLRWTVPPEPDVIGYRLYLGGASREYHTRLDLDLLPATTVGGVTGFVLADPPSGPTFVAVTAVGLTGLESEHSNEKLIPVFTGGLPVIGTGPDRTGFVGDLVDIGGPPEAGTTYLWWQRTGPAPLVIADPTASETAVKAMVPGTYILQLVAANTLGFAVKDEVVVTIYGAPSPTPTLPSPTPTATRTSSVTVTPTSSPTPPPGEADVFGAIEYFGNGMPVADVSVDVLVPGDPEEPPRRSARTDNAGQFAINDLPRGTWELQPRAVLADAGAISALDAAYVLQAVMGLRPVSEQQRLACDASGNGTLSALDASLILQRVIGLRGSVPAADSCGADWLFDPVLDDSGVPGRRAQIGAEGCRPGAFTIDTGGAPVGPLLFRAVVLGDCTGNWSSGAALTVGATTPPEVTLLVRRADRHHSVATLRVESVQPMYALAAELRAPARALRARVRSVAQGAAIVGDLGADRFCMAVAGSVPLGGGGLAEVEVLLEADEVPEVEVVWVRVNEDPAIEFAAPGAP